MIALLVALSWLLGLLVGSFLNVVIHRVPVGISVIRPASRCPQCAEPIRSRDNVPVLSWLLLRRRCRHCRLSISARYPLVEVLTAALFAVMAWRFGLDWQLPAFLYLAAISIALAVIDVDVRRLPDAIVLPSYGVVAALLLLPAVLEDRGDDLLRAVIGGLALFGLYFALVLANPRGMGFGDAKLAGVLGGYLGWLGWGALAVGAFAGFLLGGVFGLALMLAGRAGRKSAIPFGPFMLAGAVFAVLFGQQVADGYLQLMGG